MKANRTVLDAQKAVGLSFPAELLLAVVLPGPRLVSLLPPRDHKDWTPKSECRLSLCSAVLKPDPRSLAANPLAKQRVPRSCEGHSPCPVASGSSQDAGVWRKTPEWQTAEQGQLRLQGNCPAHPEW